MDRHRKKIARANVVVLGHDAAEDLFPGEITTSARKSSAAATSSPSSACSTSSRSPSAADEIRRTTPPIFRSTTFRKIHPEIKDFWIVVKYDDPANKDLVTEEIRELLRVRRNVRVRAGRQLRHLQPRLSHPALEPAHRRSLPFHGRRFLGRPDGRRRGRDEHHAGQRHGTHPRNRHPQSHRRSARSTSFCSSRSRPSRSARWAACSAFSPVAASRSSCTLP